MRKQLEEIGFEERLTYTATFKRFGKKNGFEGRIVTTLLFVDIMKDDTSICDHLWFTMGKQFEKLNLNSGDIIEFSARVSVYEKGYFGHRYDVYVPYSKDYRLSYPTKIKVIKRYEGEPNDNIELLSDSFFEQEQSKMYYVCTNNV